MRQQFKLDGASKLISALAVDFALQEFVSRFNYYECYPRRANSSASMDVYAVHSSPSSTFRARIHWNELTNVPGVSGGSASNYVAAMENMGLISSAGQRAAMLVTLSEIRRSGLPSKIS